MPGFSARTVASSRPEPGQHPGAESLDEHVGLGRQLESPGAVVRVLEVQLDAALALR